MLQEELIPADENVSHPLEDLGVVEDLVLDQLLGHGEKHLRVDVPKGVDDMLGVPHLNLIGLGNKEEDRVLFL